MPKYLLDTDICIYLLKNKFGIKAQIKKASLSNCFISEITIAELTYGAVKSTNYEKHMNEVTEIESLFEVLPVYSSFSDFAKEKVRLQKAGQLIADFDLLIGATAIQNGLILVTNNLKHFNRIQGLEIEDWVNRL